MASHNRGGFRLNVLNPGGNDPEQHFGATAEASSGAHAPVNFHAYAACTGGSFFRETARAIAARAPVLLLLRGDFRAAERALASLRKTGITIAVSLKETGLHQIADQLQDSGRLTRFLGIVRDADGCLAPTAEAADFYRSIPGKQAASAFIPTPYPLDDSAWDFTESADQRRGILVGTREWKIAFRNHAAALFAARQISDATSEPITTFNVDRGKGRRLLAQLDFPPEQLRVIDGPISYREYLRVVTGHKLVFQLDTGFVPGQVAGDALLCRMPCVGGNGTVERAVFPDVCGVGRSTAELVELAIRLLGDRKFYDDTVARSQAEAQLALSFSGARDRLAAFFGSLTPKAA